MDSFESDFSRPRSDTLQHRRPTFLYAVCNLRCGSLLMVYGWHAVARSGSGFFRLPRRISRKHHSPKTVQYCWRATLHVCSEKLGSLFFFFPLSRDCPRKGRLTQHRRNLRDMCVCVCVWISVKWHRVAVRWTHSRVPVLYMCTSRKYVLWTCCFQKTKRYVCNQNWPACDPPNHDPLLLCVVRASGANTDCSWCWCWCWWRRRRGAQSCSQLVWMQLFAVQHLYNRNTWQISAFTAQRS